MLIELGADVRQMSSIGWPPLFYAVEANRKEIVEHIAELDLKDNVHCIVDKKRTPLMVAAMQGAVESAEILMKAYPFTVNWQVRHILFSDGIEWRYNLSVHAH